MPDIAIFVPSLRGGGAERVMVTLANAFAARGLAVDLVLARAEGPYLPEVSAAVRIVNLDRGRVLAALVPLARYLRRDRPGAMLSALNHANVVAILARALVRVPLRLVVSERNSLSGLRGWRGRVMLALMRRAYPAADHVIAVTEEMRDELVGQLGLHPVRVSAIPNPVDIDALRARAAERPDHPWLAPGQSPVLLAVGRLTPQKDYPTLIRAFAELRAARPCRLVILGEGGVRGALTALAAELGVAEDMALPGFVANPFGWMAACSVFVMSSRHEGFPNALVQAIACDARVVSTDCPTGPAEILDNGRWGRLVPVGDHAALARALAEALDDPAPPDSAARARAFRADTITVAYLDVLRPGRT